MKEQVIQLLKKEYNRVNERGEGAILRFCKNTLQMSNEALLSTFNVKSDSWLRYLLESNTYISIKIKEDEVEFLSR